jgi:hypothetical protein
LFLRTHGYSGSQYDRFVERRETSTLHKFKETFWTTKQAVIQKLGKKEDEHVVASDSELDSKLEVNKKSQLSFVMYLLYFEFETGHSRFKDYQYQNTKIEGPSLQSG